MLTPIRFDDLGHFKNDWLDTRYHFSFSDYHNPDRMGFGPLRVINDDIVRAGTGFGLHPHRNMEIITYVRKGAIIHTDSLGNEGRTQAGDVQVMTAGRGLPMRKKAPLIKIPSCSRFGFTRVKPASRPDGTNAPSPRPRSRIASISWCPGGPPMPMRGR